MHIRKSATPEQDLDPHVRVRLTSTSLVRRSVPDNQKHNLYTCLPQNQAYYIYGVLETRRLVRCKERHAYCLPAGLDVASACDTVTDQPQPA